MSATVQTDPLSHFETWYSEALARVPKDANAFTLATVSAGGQPSARVVLLKEFGPRGFCFYTNYDSHKGKDLAERHKAAMCFYWPSLDRQIRIEGVVSRGSASESDAYFTSRPRGSQLGAWASLQSQPLASRAALEGRLAALETEYAGKPVPRPAHWGGYWLSPERLEFWTAQESRLHIRELYVRHASGWEKSFLFP